jgi:plastocyanin
MSNAREISTSYQRDLPAGGSTGQALVKASNTSFEFGFVTLEDVIWANVSDKIGNIVSNVGALTTDNVSEGTNLYFTNSRVRLATIPAVTQLVISTPVFNYNIDQYTGDNPTIYVNAGQTVSFELTQGSSHPFNIRVSNGGANYNTGLTHIDLDGTVSTGASAQGKYTGKLFWKIPHDIGGSTYVYQCSNHSSMVGNIVIQIPQILLTTSNVTEGSNLYFTNTRARQSITVTGSGSYDNATGIITITGGVESVNGSTGNVVLTTANIAESGNLYFTNARVRAAVGTATPDTLIYYASNGNFSVNVTAIPGSVTSVNGVSGDVTLTTSNISEGTNQYFTTTRARTSISGGTGITYYSANGVISLPQSVSTSANVSFNNLNLTEQITFPGQGMGDYANIRITDTGGGTSRLQFYVGDNSVDGIDFFVISANNGVRINDYQVWHAGNDGAGSGLNADLLDGIQAASFLQTGTNTDSIGEGSTNLYFTTTRARNSFSAGSGIDITNGVISATGGGGGGASNLDQLTDVVISSPVNGQVLKYNGTNWVNGTDATGSGGGGTVDSVNGQTGVVVLDTDDIAEATNLYFTTTRARNSFSAGTGVNITSGQISIGQSVATTDNVTFNRVNVGVNGLAFPADAFGGSGDAATITLTTAGGEATRMTFTMTNDADDMFSFVAPSNDGLLMNGNKVWHAGNDGAGSGLDADLLDGQQGSYYASNSYVASLTTSSVTEGSNLYFTNARARASISVTGNASYDSGTGVIYVPPASVQSIPAGYAGALLYSNTKYTFTASNNQSIFVGADDNGQTLVLADPAKTHVFLNGVLLTANTDYRAYQTNVTLLETTAANNILTIVDGLIALDISNVSSHIVPTTSNVYDLGSVTKYWRDLYLSGNTLRLGNVLIKDIGGSVGFSSPTGSSINLTANILNATRITENGSNVVTQADIGTAPNEIPLNQHLGSMAYEASINYYSTGLALAFKNRIINGAMMIDQRNAGNVVYNAGVGELWSVDRFSSFNSTSSNVAIQQDTIAPSGFLNSIKVTVISNDASVDGAEHCTIAQSIEGVNTSDIGWGTAFAKPITLSFWVRSSITGLFSGALNPTKGGAPRAFVFTYNINVANTWEYKVITVPGDTGGTWLYGNQVGIYLAFSLGCGPDRSNIPWQWITSGTTNVRAATGETKLVNYSGATWHITGIQLEVGTQATAFDWRPFGTELQLCQRYFEKLSFALDAYTGTSGWALTSGAAYFGLIFSVDKRATPTLSASGTFRGQGLADTNDSSTYTLDAAGNKSGRMILTAAFAGTNGQAVTLQSRSSGAFYQASAEL